MTRNKYIELIFFYGKLKEVAYIVCCTIGQLEMVLTDFINKYQVINEKD